MKIISILKGKDKRAQDALERLISSTGDNPKILWYPSAGSDYRDILELSPARASLHRISELPDLFIHTDYNQDRLCEGSDEIAYKDSRTEVKILNRYELNLIPEINYNIDPNYVVFPAPAPRTPTIYLLDILITSTILGEIKKSLIYFLFENINFLDKVILKNKIPISHIVKVRAGWGGAGISIVYYFLSQMKTKYLLIDTQENTNFNILKKLKIKHSLNSLDYSLTNISSLPNWSELDVNIYTTKFCQYKLTDEKFKKILGAISDGKNRDCGQGGYHMQTFKIIKERGHIIIKIDDKRALLDTGSPFSISPRPFDFLGERHTVQSNFMGINTQKISEFLETPIDILIGCDILSQYTIRIRWRDGYIDFGDDIPDGKIHSRLETLSGIPIFTILLRGNKSKAIFDTGAHLSYIDPELIAGLSPSGQCDDFYPFIGRFRADTFTVPTTLYRDPVNIEYGILPDKLQMMLENAKALSGAQAVIGTQILDFYDCTISWNRDTISWSPNRIDYPAGSSSPASVSRKMKEKEKDISNKLIDHGQKLFSAPKQPIAFTNKPKANALLNDLDNHPHAFVLGCVMDRQIRAERAWLIPYSISQKIGGFSMQKLSKLSQQEVNRLMTEPEPLHRLVNKMSEFFHLAVKRISNNDYEGDASRIWTGRPSSAKVVERFLEFKGVGPKIASMAANILAREFKIPFSDYYSIDISADVHVRRVFSRLGLCSADVTVEQVIYKARALYPKFPGIMDLPCWEIGRQWCKPQAPVCSKCYMNNLCPTAK